MFETQLIYHLISSGPAELLVAVAFLTAAILPGIVLSDSID